MKSCVTHTSPVLMRNRWWLPKLPRVMVSVFDVSTAARRTRCPSCRRSCTWGIVISLLLLARAWVIMIELSSAEICGLRELSCGSIDIVPTFWRSDAPLPSWLVDTIHDCTASVFFFVFWEPFGLNFFDDVYHLTRPSLTTFNIKVREWGRRPWLFCSALPSCGLL